MSANSVLLMSFLLLCRRTAEVSAVVIGAAVVFLLYLLWFSFVLFWVGAPDAFADAEDGHLVLGFEGVGAVVDLWVWVCVSLGGVGVDAADGLGYCFVISAGCGG